MAGSALTGTSGSNVSARSMFFSSVVAMPTM
jgi:hypothetical protein